MQQPAGLLRRHLAAFWKKTPCGSDISTQRVTGRLLKSCGIPPESSGKGAGSASMASPRIAASGKAGNLFCLRITATGSYRICTCFPEQHCHFSIVLSVWQRNEKTVKKPQKIVDKEACILYYNIKLANAN